MFVQWNTTHRVLCDEMGLPLTKEEVRDMELLVKAHLKTPPSKLLEARKALMKSIYPTVSTDNLTVEMFK